MTVFMDSAAGVIEDLIAYLDFIAANTRSNGQVSNRYFNLDALNLRAGGIEFVEIYVDGVLTDPTAVTAEDDAFTTDEDSALSADVSSNDMPADGVTFTLLSTVESGTLTCFQLRTCPRLAAQSRVCLWKRASCL